MRAMTKGERRAIISGLRTDLESRRKYMGQVLKAAAYAHGISVRSMLERDRRPHVVAARWLAIRHAYRGGVSQDEIARFMGIGRGTVWNALNGGRGDG